MSIILRNTSNGNLSFVIAWWQTTHAATLMPGGSMAPTPVRLRQRGGANSYDVTRECKVDEDAALAIVRASPEVQALKARNMLAVIDTRPPPVTVVVCEDVVETLVEELDLGVEMDEAVVEPVEAPADPLAALGDVAEEVAEAPSAPAAKLAEDAEPSHKWSLERLVEHARGRGLEVPDNASKRLVLRTIRGE